eukprot:3230647-Rhodomonas_salina.3
MCTCLIRGSLPCHSTGMVLAEGSGATSCGGARLSTRFARMSFFSSYEMSKKIASKREPPDCNAEVAGKVSVDVLRHHHDVQHRPRVRTLLRNHAVPRHPQPQRPPPTGRLRAQSHVTSTGAKQPGMSSY